ncbi:dihydrofolate synthase [Gracilibacillus boraciitolerans JCM 21714]|uniref:Dihydrofolate synthase n=1 Tax=Gracilibacillus boraciitolerans JCM 21714 TaxID=1298598 RepID=W4VGU8_9BACI|nr:cyanophycin synthetase [Gracilibacillus boraciitolerans]GAE92635.1 dihydrofolate synthase [Gracilibacillus boraciitolerans JCM 21714]
MKGNHQFDNAALAIKAILLLEKNSLYIDLNQLKRGLQKAQLPLRFERIKSNPVIVLDGAHNEESLKAFIDTVQLYYPDREK